MGNDRLTRLVSQHALFWLMAGNVVGVWLAMLLIFPELNRLTGEVTYGRVIPVHLNIQLYGWTSLPLIAWLFELYPSTKEGDDILARAAPLIWSATLLIGSISWLMGRISGKIFLEWQGFPRILFCFNLLWVWVALLRRYVTLMCFRSAAQLLRLCGLVVLAIVIPTWFWASSPRVYPAVNPDSGGPTAGSLLGSTLVVVCLLLMVGRWLGRQGSRVRIYWMIFAIEAITFLLFGGGNKSHRSVIQIALLAMLLPWPPLLLEYFREVKLQRNAIPWMKSALGWFALLTFTGWISFLPKVLDGWKFSNALVAHSHLAMAGFVTCFNLFLLSSLGGEFGTGSRRIWNLATLTYVALMWIAGTLEAVEPGFTILSSPARSFLYAGRALSGLVMFACSLSWWRRSLVSVSGSVDSEKTTLESPLIPLAA